MRAALGLAVGALLLVGTTTTFAQGTPGATADLKMANGTAVGTATFTQESGGVRLKAQFKGLPAGQHGIHVHAVGKCDGPDFMTAGGHFNPTNHQHGLKNPQGAHAGDMENLTVAADGTGSVDALLKDVSLGTGAGSLFGPDGTALVIHAQADDEMTDPSGNSGARIACGQIMKAGAAAPVAQPSPVASPVPAVTLPAPAPKPATSAAPSQAPAPVASPAALPRTGTAGLPIDASLPAAIAGLAAVATGLVISRRRR
ncbi:MAG: superoxide dismutase family protein [Chloroflexota bacterium]